MPTSGDDLQSGQNAAGKSAEQIGATRQSNQSAQEPAQAEDLSGGADSAAEAVRATESIFQDAIGLRNLPEKGMIEFTVKAAEMQAQRAEGVSRAQSVCFISAQGEKLFGAQYTKSDGSYFKTRDGDTYLLTAESNGNFLLSPIGGAGSEFTAIQVMVLPDLLVLNNLEVRQAGTGTPRQSSEHFGGASDSSAPSSVERTQLEQIEQTEAFDLADIVEPIAESKPESFEEPVPESITPEPRSDVSEGSAPADESADVASEDEELIKQKIRQRNDERRRRYVIKDKDTLESIATKQLRDVRLAELMFEINKHLIPVKVVRGRPVRHLKLGTIIFLPTAREVNTYRERTKNGQ